MSETEKSLRVALAKAIDAELPFLVFWVEREADWDNVRLATNLDSVDAASLHQAITFLFERFGVVPAGSPVREDSGVKVSGEG